MEAAQGKGKKTGKDVSKIIAKPFVSGPGLLCRLTPPSRSLFHG